MVTQLVLLLVEVVVVVVVVVVEAVVVVVVEVVELPVQGLFVHTGSPEELHTQVLPHSPATIVPGVQPPVDPEPPAPGQEEGQVALDPSM